MAPFPGSAFIRYGRFRAILNLLQALRGLMGLFVLLHCDGLWRRRRTLSAFFPIMRHAAACWRTGAARIVVKSS